MFQTGTSNLYKRIAFSDASNAEDVSQLYYLVNAVIGKVCKGAQFHLL